MNNIYAKKHIFLLFAFLSVLTLYPHRDLHSQNTAPPTIILSSYTIEGNALTDDIITVHLILTNASKSYNIFNALFTYSLPNETFLPASGSSNQFIIPLIRINSSIEYKLELSVQNAIPNEILYINFDISFSDDRGITNTSAFFISKVLRSTEVIQLMGIKVIEAEKVSDNFRNASLRISVINQSVFLAKNVVMQMEGSGFDFSASIPFNDISPGAHSIRYFNLNIASGKIPEVIAKFTYNDAEGIHYESIPQRFFIYMDHVVQSKEMLNKEGRVVFLIRTGLFVVLTIGLIIGTFILLLKLNKKREV